MSLLQDAQQAIIEHLRQPEEYARSVVEVLTDGEMEQIAGHLRNEAGGVAIAALIYRARLRLAAAEADVHHQTICDTVPLPEAPRRTEDRRNSEAVRHPGIRVVPSPFPPDAESPHPTLAGAGSTLV